MHAGTDDISEAVSSSDPTGEDFETM